jgi:hypothetical protein
MALPFIVSIIVALEILLGSESVGDTTLSELQVQMVTTNECRYQ